MKKNYLLLLLSLTALNCSAQTDTVRVTYDTIEDLEEQVEQNEIDELEYVDNTFSYRVIVPGWLTLMDTRNPTLWGGIFPKVDDIENVLLIKGFAKSEFNDFNDFKDIYLTGNSFGKPVKWGTEQTWFGQNDLVEIENGVKQKVFIMHNNLIYHNQFVLLESKTGYLWIQFAATPETYSKNLDKFDEFISSLQLLN
jgi:hypothetical protein